MCARGASGTGRMAGWPHWGPGGRAAGRVSRPRLLDRLPGQPSVLMPRDDGQMRLAPNRSICVQVSLAFPKFSLCHFAFTKDLHLYLFSLTNRNPKRIFTFTEKGATCAQNCRMGSERDSKTKRENVEKAPLIDNSDPSPKRSECFLFVFSSCSHHSNVPHLVRSLLNGNCLGLHEDVDSRRMWILALCSLRKPQHTEE